RYVFDDTHNLDSAFDAGGNVSASLTATTLAAQLLWPADLMQSATVAVKYGIAGVFWYCGAVLIILSLFPLFSFQFKIKAPGAKTFLQIILARCGRVAHSVFCGFAFLVNVIVLASIIVGGIAVLQVTVKDASPEFCIILLATLCGSFTFIGGLGSTFYVSYFNTLTTFVVLIILMFSVFYVSDPPYGTLEEIYEKVNCLPNAQGNRDGSYFTFLSEGSLLWAIQGVFVVSSFLYCDQASWQSRIAAKPLQGAIGFLLACVIWFAVPATIGTVAGITYLAQTAVDPEVYLSDDQINSGIVSTFMSQHALGKTGGIMMLTMLTMLTMSTGSGEIMGVASIVVYDIYQTYIRPYRFKHPQGSCLFCGLYDPKLERTSLSTHNSSCKVDLERLNHKSRVPGNVVQYNCSYHGNFRAYQDSLIDFKNWCILWITLGLIPFGLALNSSGVDLNWTMVTGVVVTVPCFPGVLFCILWSKLTTLGLIIGCLSGLVCGLCANMLVAFVYFQGEGGFILATSQLYAVVAGSVSGIVISLTLTVTISLCTHKITSPEDEAEVWQKLRDIDNPLHPWALQFVDEFPEVKDGLTRPTASQLDQISKKGKIASIIGSIIIIVVFIIIIPSTLAGLEVLTANDFKIWTTAINVWCVIMAVVITVVTPVEEIKAIVLQLREKKRQKEANVDAAAQGQDAEAEFAVTLQERNRHAALTNGTVDKGKVKQLPEDDSNTDRSNMFKLERKHVSVKDFDTEV
ncbi:unnamed protein product, partial [Candidula unifasciata]